MDFAAMKPADLRGLIRKGKLTGPTTGMCNGYAQGNLVVLPKALAWDFLLFCQRNPKACPLLEVADAGERTFCNLVRRTEKGRLRRRGWGLRWEKAQKGGKGTNLRGFFED